MEARFVVRQLGFVNNQPGVRRAALHRFENLVEGDDHGFEIGLENFQREIRGGHGAGNGDFFAFDLFRLHGMHGNDHGSVTVSHARSAGHQRILVGHICVGVIGDGAEIVDAFHGLAVQSLDIRQDMRKVTQPTSEPFSSRARKT